MTTSKEVYKIAIIGTGPAGFTAAIYAGRANYRPIIFEGMQPGGQLTTTTEVENYPGFPEGVQGPELMDLFRKQAERFGAEPIFKEVTEVDFNAKPFRISCDDDNYFAETIIIATGATAKYLGLPSETEYRGAGVSACATCDGFFFKNQHIAVVGGGDTAMEEATYLTKHAGKVTLIHRRDQFRASKIMQQRVKENPKIELLLDTVVEEVLGKNENGRKSMAGLKLKSVKGGDISTLPVTGLFLAIGHQPNTKIFEGKLKMNDVGYILTEPHSTRTSKPGVFAAGDVADPTYRQAVSAAGTGCMAAIDAERYLTEHGL
jgi:thioredoxin reductase (NADPH)